MNRLLQLCMKSGDLNRSEKEKVAKETIKKNKFEASEDLKKNIHHYLNLIDTDNLTINQLTRRLKHLSYPTLQKMLRREAERVGRLDVVTNSIERHKHKSICKPVSQYTLDDEFIASFDSIALATENTQVDKNHISLCCNNKRKSAGGYKWKFM